MNVEGRNAVYELLSTDKTVDKIMVQNGLRDDESRKLVNAIKESGIKFSYTDKSVLDKMSTTKRHQGFIAVVTDFLYSDLDEIISGCIDSDGMIAVLDGVEDVHNLGSIIRVCECAGVSGLVIGKHRSASVNDTVMRISEGSVNHVKIARVTNINDAIDTMKEKGIWIYALELGGDNIYKTDLRGKIAVIIGGEDTGVNKLTKKKADFVVSIPMLGKINSLNASVAAGVALFEALRQRTQK